MHTLPDIKVLALDLDGTIVTHDYRLSARTIAAVSAFRESGRHVLIASGRSRLSALPWAARLGGISGMICHNGAAVYDFSPDETMGKEIAATLLPEGTARRIVAFARTLDIHFHAFCGESWLYETTRPGTAIYEKRSGFKGQIVDFDTLPVLGCYKVMFVSEPGPQIDAAADRLRELCAGEASVFFTSPGFLEIVAPTVSKASGLKSWLDTRRLSPGQVLALGDADNDREMLMGAGIGVAMGNAPAELRTLVGLTTGTVDEDGAADVIERFLAGTL